MTGSKHIRHRVSPWKFFTIHQVYTNQEIFKNGVSTTKLIPRLESENSWEFMATRYADDLAFKVDKTHPYRKRDLSVTDGKIKPQRQCSSEDQLLGGQSILVSFL